MMEIAGLPLTARCCGRYVSRAFPNTLLLLLLLILAGPCPVLSAEFTITKQSTEGITVLELSGPILREDDVKFSSVASRAPLLFTIVVMESPGGDVRAALGIGKEIRLRGFSTLVKPGRLCTSACALAWLAGDERYMAKGAKIGFHAAFAVEGNTPVEKGTPNALIGAYLQTLKLSEAAIAYITQASPSEVTWLTVLTAMHVGINLKVIGEDGN
jgi:hypothetical protein